MGKKHRVKTDVLTIDNNEPKLSWKTKLYKVPHKYDGSKSTFLHDDTIVFNYVCGDESHVDAMRHQYIRHPLKITDTYTCHMSECPRGNCSFSNKMWHFLPHGTYIYNGPNLKNQHL